MWVVVEMEWDFNNLEWLNVYGPFRSEAKAKKVCDRLLANKKSWVSYSVKEVNKLKS